MGLVDGMGALCAAVANLLLSRVLSLSYLIYGSNTSLKI